MHQSYDTIIIGLGAAGTTAAATGKAGKRVLALEAQDRLGVRVYTVPFGDGVVEVGAEWVHESGGSRVYETAVQNNMSLVQQDYELKVYRSDGTIGDHVLVNDLKNFCIEVAHNPGDKPEPLGRFLTERLMKYITEKYPNLLKDEDFIKEFLAIMNLVINNYESSNDWNDNRYNNGPGWPTLDIKLNKEVTLINWLQNKTGSVEVICKDRDVYTADNVIVTVSIGVLRERHSSLFVPALPWEKSEAIDKVTILKLLLCPSHLDGQTGKFVSIAYIPTINDKLSLDAHLKIEHVKKVCSNSAAICKSNDTNICAVRSLNGKNDLLDFKNACFLFIQNMCTHFGKEYSIISSGNCFQYFKSRRNNKKNNGMNKSTTTIMLNGTKVTMSKRILREDTKSTLYEVDTAFDYHACPLSCPNVYSPVCIGVNRGHGLYYKFFTFVNHCEGDLYYCKNWREFSPPPGEDELIRSSPLSWSFCAANRYIQFARFTEMTSAMGHYGWLAGDYRPTHIMEPHQRVPGFG